MTASGIETLSTKPTTFSGAMSSMPISATSSSDSSTLAPSASALAPSSVAPSSGGLVRANFLMRSASVASSSFKDSLSKTGLGNFATCSTGTSFK